MSIVIINISLLSLINARCFKMCKELGVHSFQIGRHWSFFLHSLIFHFLLNGGFALGLFLAIYKKNSLVFIIFPLCFFIECPFS